MEQLKKIKNLLGMTLVCTLILLYSSCRTDLIYGTRGNRVEGKYYSKYQKSNLQLFNTQKYQKLKNGKHGRLYHEFMRPYKNNGKITRQRLPKYNN